MLSKDIFEELVDAIISTRSCCGDDANAVAMVAEDNGIKLSRGDVARAGAMAYRRSGMRSTAAMLDDVGGYFED